MGLDKAIKYGKERRRPYRKAKAVDCSCRNHGSCPWCSSGRQHFDTRRRIACETDMREWQKEEETMIICDFCRKEILESQSFIELPTHSSVELPVSYIFIHRDCFDSFVAHIPKAKRVIEKEDFQKEILKYLKVTADMAEDNDELAWRIWQVYGRLEDLWEVRK